MNSDQVKMLKDSFMMEATKPDGKRSTLGEYMRFLLDNNVDYVTSKDCVIFDDKNTMIHCIAMNEDLRGQANYPIKIISADYSMIQQVETVMSQTNFERFLKEGFISDLLSSEKSEFIKKWSRNIKNQAMQPMEPEPYYSQNPTIIPMPNTVIKRDDGIEHAESPARMSWDTSNSIKVIRADNVQELEKYIDEADNGDTIYIDSNVKLEGLNIKGKSIKLVSNGATVTGVCNFEAENVSVSGFNFIIDGNPDTSKPKPAGGTYGIKVICNDFTFKKNNISISGSAYNCIRIMNTGSVNIEENNFNTCGSIWNTIEFSQSANEKISVLNINNNVFRKGCCNNNAISMFQFTDNAIVNICNNIFEYSANALRISNYGNNKNIIINCIRNKYLETCDNEYAGFVLFQAVKKEDFANITLLINNLTGPKNELMIKNGIGLKQVWYTYNTNTIPNVIFSA